MMMIIIIIIQVSPNNQQNKSNKFETKCTGVRYVVCFIALFKLKLYYVESSGRRENSKDIHG